jgi:hypothetical protein
LTTAFAVVAERLHGGSVAGIERCLARGKEAGQRRVGGSDHRRSTGRALRSRALNEDRRVAPFDAVERIEDRGVHDSPEPLARRVGGACRNQRVDEYLVPLQHLVDGDR